MSNFKKFLALVLATLMVASMMVISAPAASAYAPTGDYADDIALLNTLGVMLGDNVSFGEKENVTRWQMALLIARIVTGETGNDMWEAEKSEFFTDVTADHYPGAIDFCAEMGYIKGVGDNKFEPEENITYQDGLTMLVRLLGYETENMSYPWGYILKARTLATTAGKTLTADIDTGNKTPLLREEVANLLAKAIKIELADAKGVPQTDVTLMVTGLKGIDLGKGTLCATWNAGIGNATFAKYGEATFSYKVGTTTKWETVKVANISNTGDLALNDLLGFTADLVSVKGKVIATMSNVSVVDSYKLTDDKIDVKVGDVTIKNVKTYGTDDQSIFVDSTAEISTKGRLLVCDINNDGIDKDDVARYIPFNAVKALYVATNVATKKDKGWPVDASVKVYFERYSTDMFQYQAALADKAAKNNAAAKVQGIYSHDDTNKGLYMANTVSSATDKYETAKSALNDPKYIVDTEYCVSVIGDLKHGEVFLGAIHKIDGLTFVTVAAPVEIVKGTAVLGGADNNTSLKLGDTLMPVGFDKTAIAITNKETIKDVAGTSVKTAWYTEFSSISANTINAFAGEKVNYITVDGKVVAIELYEKAAEKKTSPYNKDSLILNVYEATVNNVYKTNVTVNADNTLTINVYNPTTMAFEDVKVDQINGVKVGQLVNQLGAVVSAKMILGEATTVNTTTGIVKALVASATPNTIDGAKVGLVAVTNVVDGVYSISTAADDIKAIKKVVVRASAGDEGKDPTTAVNLLLTFKQYTGNSITTGTYALGTHKPVTTSADNWTWAAKYLTVNKNTKFVIIAADGISVTTNVLPKDGDTLRLNRAVSTILELSNEKVVIYTTANTADVISFASAPISAPVNKDGNWYTLTWTSKFVGTEIVVNEDDSVEFHYSFKDLRNLTTGAIENVVIVSDAYTATPAKSFFKDAWLADGTKEAVAGAADSTTKKIPADKANTNIYKVFYISAEGELTDSSMFSWAIANEYNIGIIKGIANKNLNKLVIDAVNVAEGSGAYVVTAGQANAVQAVVSYQITFFNLSKDITKDEITTGDATAVTSGMCGKILGTGDTYGDLAEEYCFYKLNEDGTAVVVVNMFDGVRSDTTTIADGLVPVVDAQ